jgi:hypothetical protein
MFSYILLNIQKIIFTQEGKQTLAGKSFRELVTRFIRGWEAEVYIAFKPP